MKIDFAAADDDYDYSDEYDDDYDSRTGRKKRSVDRDREPERSGDLHAGKRGAAFLWLLLSEKAGERFPVLLQQ